MSSYFNFLVSLNYLYQKTVKAADVTEVYWSARECREFSSKWRLVILMKLATKIAYRFFAV